MLDPNTATFTGPLEAQQLKAASHILVYALPELMAAKLGSQMGVPNNNGDQLKFTYFDLFPVTGVSIIEGIPPASQPLVRRNVVLTLQQYGMWTPITDWTVDLHPDDIMEPILRNLATWMAQTIEKVTLNSLLSGLNVLYAGGVASRAALASTITRQMVGRVNEIFNTFSAQKIKEIMSASSGFATTPIAASFVGIITPAMEDDLRHCANWKPVSSYSNPRAMLPNEVGNVDNVRFCTNVFLTPWLAAATSAASQTTFRSSNADTATGSAGSADVHPILFLAKDAFACANLNKTKSGEVKLRKPGMAVPGDELGQTGSAGIKFWYASTILTDYYLIRGEACVTNPSKVSW